MRRLGLIRPRNLVPSPSRRRVARCWPSVGLRGGQRRCHRMSSGLRVVACHSRGTDRGRPVAPQSTCPGSSWRQESHLPYTSTGLLRQQRHATIRKVPSWHVRCGPSATGVATRAWLDVQRHWGPPCSDDPVSNSAVTEALVAGCA